MPVTPVRLDGLGPFLMPKISSFRGLASPAQAELPIHIHLLTVDGKELGIPM